MAYIGLDHVKRVEKKRLEMLLPPWASSHKGLVSLWSLQGQRGWLENSVPRPGGVRASELKPRAEKTTRWSAIICNVSAASARDGLLLGATPRSGCISKGDELGRIFFWPWGCDGNQRRLSRQRPVAAVLCNSRADGLGRPKAA